METKTTFLDEIDTIISTYIHSTLEEYATELMNKFIENAKMDSFCVNGVCYYTTCEHDNCKVLHCRYHLLTNEEKCSTKISSGMFKLYLHKNKIPPLEENKVKSESDNSEDNNIKIVNRIINK